MPHWTTRSLAWARDNLLRPRPRALSATVGYERAGLARWGEPVPWTADAALAEVRLAVRPSARRKPDFALRLAHGTFAADALRVEADGTCRACFRFPVPPETGAAEVLWRGRPLATVPVRAVWPAGFLAGLALGDFVLAARFGDTTATVAALVPGDSDALLASAVLRAPGGLQLLPDVGLEVRFACEATGYAVAVPVRPSAQQLARAEALVAAACPDVPREPGTWTVTVAAGARELALRRVSVLPRARFEAGVRAVETRFAVREPSGAMRSAKGPELAGAARAGPCFVLCGSDPGAAARCRFEVLAVPTDPFAPPHLFEADAVVTDSPAPFVPALFDAAELEHYGEFELRLNDRLLGVASLRPVPRAALTAEGGFAPPEEFVWSSAAEEELAARLRRLG
jgi:hypothetical protein